MRQRINELERLERMRDTGEFERITKKEALLLSREIERLEMLLGGIRTMIKVPDLLFVVDVQREATAIHEANILEIPVVGMVDTNCDPRDVDYVVPSNDDAIRAIKLMVGKIADAAAEGRAMRKEEEVEEEYVRMPERAYAEEPELTDEDLLGEATLAKLGGRVEVYEELEEAGTGEVDSYEEEEEAPAAVEGEGSEGEGLTVVAESETEPEAETGSEQGEE
jgi:small subunit ribosomal protein S2